MRAHHLRQPLGTRHRRRARVVRGASAMDQALHAEACFLAEPDRVRLLDPAAPRPHPWILRLPGGTAGGDLHVHVVAQRDGPAVPLVLPAEVLVDQPRQNFWSAALATLGGHLATLGGRIVTLGGHLATLGGHLATLG